jgi:hypothetical protein
MKALILAIFEAIIIWSLLVVTATWQVITTSVFIGYPISFCNALFVAAFYTSFVFALVGCSQHITKRLAGR